MQSPANLNQLAAVGSMDPQDLARQMAFLQNGVAPVVLLRPASLGDGIDIVQDPATFVAIYMKELAAGLRPQRFIPASGAATRMFAGERATMQGLLEQLKICEADFNLPKLLLPFHRYADGAVRTALEEHLRESASYAAAAGGVVRVHFTLSLEHQALFQTTCAQLLPPLQSELAVTFELTSSCQDPATDTLAMDERGELLRDGAGEIIFRPGGHGALLKNLGAVSEANLVFIKNVDNVQREDQRLQTVFWKKVLAGVLLEHRHPSLRWDDTRPMRVCGVVKNTGEPGGGPFWVRDTDGAESLQIVERGEVDFSDSAQKKIFQSATHFNPVDIVCCFQKSDTSRFELDAFVDQKRWFLAEKMELGQRLRALERPGLWNGGMGKWQTVFVEVPQATFTPVKSLLDLARPGHL